MKRRSLLALLAASSAGAAIAATPGRRSGGGNSSPQDRVLVLLELRGGNDGLNTLAPVDDPLYRQARPGLALDQAIPLERGLALHPALAPLLPIWQARRLGFALGVGWPQPNRSHFKATDQWASGSASGVGAGWLAAAFDRRGSAGPLVALGPSGSAALEGGKVQALQLAPALLSGRGPLDFDPARAGQNAILRRMLELERAGYWEVTRLCQAIAPLPASLGVPRGGLGQQVGLALQLLASGQCPPMLQLARAGYDTHANQGQGHPAGRQRVRPPPATERLRRHRPRQHLHRPAAG